MAILARLHRSVEWRFAQMCARARRAVGSDRQWARVVMDRATERHVRGLDPASLDALEVSGSRWRDTGFRSYRQTSYPDYDLVDRPLDERFDLICVEQVLEHVSDPGRAVRNLHTMLRAGGTLLVTTPFLIRVHLAGEDYTRWTEKGLRGLLARHGFAAEGIATGAWGNRACARATFLDWAPYVPWLDSLDDEPEFPVVVWAFAIKSEPS